jgi:hypothetical protein
VHLDTVKSHLLSDGCTIKYAQENFKIYIKINMKMLLHVSGQNDHHQGARRLCFAKFINIKIVNRNMPLKNSAAMWLHNLSSPVCDVNILTLHS